MILLAVPAVVAGSDWPSFRGPSQTGAVEAPGLFEGETIGLHPAWSQRLGSAYSGISIEDGRVFTMAAIGDGDFLLAFDAERGEELWRLRVGPRTVGHDGSEDGPAVTPAVAEGWVYATTSRGRLFAVDAESGRERWSVDLVAELGAVQPLYDFVASPAVAGDLVVTLAPGADSGSLAAFDRVTGEHRWSAAEEKGESTSPVVAEILGETQLLLWQKSRLDALDLQGELAWSVEFGPNDDGSPVVIGDDRILLKGLRSSALYRVRREGERWLAEQLWESRHLKGSMSAPVHYDGHLYGFDGRFLSCVDATNGERVWKSRPPGGNGVILVEDRLVVFAADGHVVIARATPEGYQEETRFKATRRESLTWPAFANGRVFVRDATHLAALRITDQPTPASATESGPPVLYEGSRFTDFVRRVEESDNPRLLIEDFFRRQSAFPIYEGDLLHFVYRGKAKDVALISPVWDPQKEFPLQPLADTGIHYRTMKLEPPTRLEYAYRIDLEEVIPDPLNPRTVERFPGVVSSEAVPPGHRDPEWLAPYAGPSPGQRRTLSVSSEHTGDTRGVELWLPAAVSGDQLEGLVVVLDGDSHLRQGQIPNILDHVVGQTVAPIAVAFVPPLQGPYWLEGDGRRTADLARMVVSDLVPAIEQQLGRDFDREEIAVLGVEMWSSAALHVGLLEPEAIGESWVLDYNGTLSLAAELDELLSQAPPEPPVHYHLVWPRHGNVMTGRFVMRDEARELDRRLRDSGRPVSGGEIVDSVGWGAYRGMIVSALEERFSPRIEDP